MAENVGVLVGVAVGIVALLLLVLLPMSFSDVNYWEYGFPRRKSTGSVDLSIVYDTGRYIVGPDYEFKTFRADAHYEEFNVAVFTSDRLEVTLAATFQYFLRKNQLPLLHDAYDIYYKPILRTNAQDALKGAATVYSTREFIANRSDVESALFKAVRDRLGGPCCDPGCDSDCIPGCTPQDQCTNNGLYARVAYFQLGYVGIPEDVESRFLRALVLNEKTETEQFIQEATVVRKDTERQVQDIRNSASVIAQNATAQAELITARANANYTATIESARSQGLNNLFTSLGISQVNYKNSFDYLRTLRYMTNAHLSVDFDQLIVGPMNAGGN